MMQQTLSDCAFCERPPGSDAGEAHTWGKAKRVTHQIRVECAIQTQPDPDEYDYYTCDGCGLVVDALAALARFRVELGHLEGTLRLCADCSPGGSATYWTRNLKEHRVGSVVE